MHVMSHSLISKMLEYCLVNYPYSALNDLILSEEKNKTLHPYVLNLYLIHDQN